MADPTAVTGIVLAIAAVGCSATPYLVARRRRSDDQDSTSIASWSALNEALNREIKRLTDDIARQRTEYNEALQQQREDYQGQLNSARRRITELEQEVGVLQRALRGEPA